MVQRSSGRGKDQKVRIGGKTQGWHFIQDLWIEFIGSLYSQIAQISIWILTVVLPPITPTITTKYKLQMTLRRPRGKASEVGLRSPEIFLKSPKKKPLVHELTPMATFHDFRSLSRSKNKLKMHIFKSPNHHNQEQLTPPQQKKSLKSYSSFGTLPQGKERPKFNARQYLGQRNALLVAKQKGVKSKRRPQKKQKKEFKLIHQIRSQRANKLQEKMMKAATRQVQAKWKNSIQSASHHQLDDFAEEMKMALQPSVEPSKSEVAMRIVEYSRPHSIDKKKSEQIQIQHIQQPSQSIVKFYVPSELLKSQQYSQIKKQSVEESYQRPDLSRSFHKASRILKIRKDSGSSMDISLRESKVRAQISLSLALQSRHDSRIDLSIFYKDVRGRSKPTGSIKDKINSHLQILQSMSTFVYESTKFDEIGDEWEELNFLIYKKFYIERRKVLNFIQKYPMRNPFCIYGAEIGSKEVIIFMKSEEGKILLSDLTKQTQEIKQKVAKIYSKFDKGKVGEKINLYEYDNFSHWIIEELWAQLILTEHNTSHSREEIQVRLCRILQLIFLISELNGKYEYSFEQAEMAISESDCGVYIREGKQLFERYILYQNEGALTNI